jgi:hypothetical protein
VGAAAAQYPAPDFYPFSQENLVNLPARHIYPKLMIIGRFSAPFSGETSGFEG